jgi:hypothetical protein
MNLVLLQNDMICAEGVVDYSITSSFPLFPGDSVCAVGIAAAGFAISSPLVIDAQGVLTLGDLDSCLRVDDDAYLVMSRSHRGYRGDVVGTFFVGGVLGAA